VFQLDEYLGIGPDDPRSLLGWTLRSFVGPLGIPLANVVCLPVSGEDATCAEYDRRVEREGGYDLAVLGIGTNGHIGFNEPPSDGSAPTREVVLSPDSIGSNARYWGGEQQVPRRAITAGMPALLRARTTLLVASGISKRDIVRRAFTGPVTPLVPASYLQGARDVTVLVDRAAWNLPREGTASEKGGARA
jgi:glucosamine-6-phosphate deaminase